MSTSVVIRNRNGLVLSQIFGFHLWHGNTCYSLLGISSWNKNLLQTACPQGATPLKRTSIYKFLTKVNEELNRLDRPHYILSQIQISQPCFALTY
ncbi:hypothetical protein AVEN_271668-1 [Araneus ventricosus]|uniref:Uncharacterized protein n=1 Tax=Araneus ventricosus TaxID=182803 RepID=A0A4Y2MDV2_ARAVE|nr:hypothetical protein AVEN_271668-1 [Araneus ventricosus]